MLHKAPMSFILKELCTGSGVALLCAFMVVQTSSAGQKRQRKRVVSSRSGRFPDPDCRQNSRLVFGRKLANYTSTWERQNDMNARPKLTALTSSPQSVKHSGGQSHCVAVWRSRLQSQQNCNTLWLQPHKTSLTFFVSPGPSIATRIFAGRHNFPRDSYDN